MHFPPPDPGYVEAITADPALGTTFVPMDGPVDGPGLGVTPRKR